MGVERREGRDAAAVSVELSAGTIEYLDTGGVGGTVVLLHGLLMDGSLWEQVILDLRSDHRCVAPTLPLGAHRVPFEGDADLSLPAVARIVSELLGLLDLDDVILVGVDTGGALAQLMVAESEPRVGRVVLACCDAFENYPPGLTGKALVSAGKLPMPLFGLFMQQLRVRAVRRLPLAFGWLTKRGDSATKQWVNALLDKREVRRDAIKVLRAIAAEPKLMEQVAERLGASAAPALIVWASEDRVMPPRHGQQLAELLGARLVEVADSYTLLPLDQPQRFAELIRCFARDAIG